MDFAYFEYQKDHLDVNLDFFGREACSSGYSFGPSVRDNYVIHYILDGQGSLHIDNFSFNLKKGNIFILPKDIITFYQADLEDPWDYIWIGLGGTKIESYLKRSSLLEDYIIYDVAGSQFIDILLELSRLSPQSHASNIDLLMDSKLYEMLYYLALEFPSRQLKVPTQQQIYFSQSLNYMFHYFNQPITVKDVYQHLNLSRSYFHHIFTKSAGISPSEFLMNLRMKKAGDLLIHSSNTITIISLSVGYRDSLTFSKAFKHYYGLPPSKFREEKGTQKYERLEIELHTDPNRSIKFKEE